jgi:hypothetical protein
MKNYQILKTTSQAVFIADLDNGKTVTNSAEQVCMELGQHPRIIYRDTDGEWGELKHRNGHFCGFAPVIDESLKTYCTTL